MTAAADNQEYRVLARKYRPLDFTSLIGQEAMVRTLSNAIDAGRLAHAFVLTGVRGVGKTTTAPDYCKGPQLYQYGWTYDRTMRCMRIL